MADGCLTKRLPGVINVSLTLTLYSINIIIVNQIGDLMRIRNIITS